MRSCKRASASISPSPASPMNPSIIHSAPCRSLFVIRYRGERFHPAVTRVVSRGVCGADSAAEARLAADCARRIDADPRADRQRQDADGVPVVAQPADVRAAAGRGRSGAAFSISLRSRRWPWTSSATCARRWRASRTWRRRRACRFTTPAIAVRTGDTPARERAKFQRAPADILITTPESLFLLLTSNAHESLKSVETVIIDEIHAMVVDQARRAPGAVARAAGADRHEAAAADWVVGDAAAAG